jgi:hypothetical protein
MPIQQGRSPQVCFIFITSSSLQVSSHRPEINDIDKNSWEFLSTGVTQYGDTRLYLGSQYDGKAYAEMLVGIRFDSVSAPAGAIIHNASIRFIADSADTVTYPNDTLVLSIFAHKSFYPASFSTSTRSLSSRTKTAANVTWTTGQWLTSGQGQTTPDLSPIIQELVNQAAWFPGTRIVIMMQRAFPVSLNPAPRHVAQYYANLTISYSRKPLKIVIFILLMSCSRHDHDDHHKASDNNPHCYGCIFNDSNLDHNHTNSNNYDHDYDKYNNDHDHDNYHDYPD